jgi:hypothetical protein
MSWTPANQGADTPFGALKQIDAGLLSAGYADVGPSDGRAVLLPHGWLSNATFRDGQQAVLGVAQEGSP